MSQARTATQTAAPLPLEGRLAALPTAPGCYLMKDARERVIYVGKAKVLRDRVRSYFGSPRSLTPKTQELVRHIADFEVVRTGTESEALLLETEGAADRREAGRTLAGVLKRSANPSVDGLIAAYGSATAPGVKASLLEVMGQIASPQSLPTVVSALKESDREVNRAALLALTDWPTPAPMPELLAVAKSADANPTSQVLALRGYIKLATIPNARPNPETARFLAEAMSLAKQPEEKRAILAALPGCPSQEALALAEASLSDPAVGKEAKAASDRIRRALNATGGRRVDAAQLLGIGRNTITRKIQELGLDDDRPETGEA